MKQGSILNFIRGSKNKEEKNSPSKDPNVVSKKIEEIKIDNQSELISITQKQENRIDPEDPSKIEATKKIEITKQSKGKQSSKEKNASQQQKDIPGDSNLHTSKSKRSRTILDDSMEEELEASAPKESKTEINPNSKAIESIISDLNKNNNDNINKDSKGFSGGESKNNNNINNNNKSVLASSTYENKSTTKNNNNNKSPNGIEKSILFSTITSALTKIEGLKGENSKDAIKECFSNLFQQIIETYPEDLSRLYYFLLSKVGPEYNSPEFGIGNETLVKCVAKATGKSDKNVKEGIHALGDLALVAMEGKKTLGTMDKFSGFVKTSEKKPLTLKKVFDGFSELANMKGKSSFTEKERILMKLFFDASNEEIKFIIRSLQKSLKIGASFKTIIAALARCISRIYSLFAKKDSKLAIEEKEAEKILLISINQMADYDLIMHKIHECILKKEAFSRLAELCCITPGIPLKPQLARPTTGINVIFQRFENIPFTCEYKYDGFRGQIHHYVCRKTGFPKTEIFSRNLENMTESYPDVVKFVDEKIRSEIIESFILDCEIVAFDAKTGKIQPFQVLTTRARKNVNIEEISIKVCMFLFDIIYLNGKTVIEKTLDERRTILKDNFKESDHIKFAKYINSDKFDEIEVLMNESIQAGCEGLIIKALYQNSTYQPGQRNFNWLKLKKDYLDTSVGDSLDLIPIGAEYGKGRRKGFYGSYLLACYNDENETFETVTMTGAGLTDENLEKFYNELTKLVIPEPRRDFRIGDIKVDVWFDPQVVWEIKTADLSLSPIYTAGNSITPSNKGISLRFPRFIRERPDKKPEDATTSEDIYKMFKSQSINNNNKIDFDNEDDFYD